MGKAQRSISTSVRLRYLQNRNFGLRAIRWFVRIRMIEEQEELDFIINYDINFRLAGDSCEVSG